MVAEEVSQVFDLARAPFRVNDADDSYQVAEEIAACFEVVAGLSAKMTQAVTIAMQVIGLENDVPLVRAAAALEIGRAHV